MLINKACKIQCLVRNWKIYWNVTENSEPFSKICQSTPAFSPTHKNQNRRSRTITTLNVVNFVVFLCLTMTNNIT